MTVNVYHGRPKEKRQDNEEYCYDVLEKLGIDYERADHDAAHGIEECRAIKAKLEYDICKNLLLCNRQETEFYLLIMPGDKPFKTKMLSKQLGVSRLSFGKEEHLDMLNVKPGCVSVLGLLFDKKCDVRLIMDREVYEGEFICCHPCQNTSTLKVKTRDIIDKLVPETGHDITIVDLPWETE